MIEKSIVDLKNHYMNTTTTGAMVRPLTNSNKFDSLTLTDNSILVQFEKKTVSKITYSDFDKIYIKVNKLKPIYGFLLVLFPILFAFLCFEYIQLNIEMSVAL